MRAKIIKHEVDKKGGKRERYSDSIILHVAMPLGRGEGFCFSYKPTSYGSQPILVDN